MAAYRAADTVVVVSDGFRANLIERGVPAAKVHTVRNGASLALFEPDAAPDRAVRARLGAGDGDCLVLYLGTHGISQGLCSVLDAASRLQPQEAASEPSIRLALVGDGADKPRLRQRVAELGLANITMLPGIPHEEVPALLGAADVCLVPLRNLPLFATFIPSKLFEAMAAGRAVIGAVAGEAAGILREAGACVVPPEDGAALASAIRSLARDPARRRAMGLQGRGYVEAHFDRTSQARLYRKLLDTAGGQR